MKELLRPQALAAAAVVLALLAPALARPLQDPDMWWLIWAGENGLPNQNLLSWTEPGQPWVIHEPLVALAFGALGPDGVGAWRALVLGSLALLLPTLAGERAWPRTLALALAIPGLSVAFSERAMAWGLLAQAALMLAAPRRPALGAALALVWSGVHGSFVLAFVLLPWRWALVALALCAAVPGGAERMGLVSSYADYGLMHAYVEEWAPLLPRDLASTLRLLALLGAYALAARRGDWRTRLVGAALVLLALRHQRMVAPAALFLLPGSALGMELPERPAGRPWPWILLGGALTALLSGAPARRPAPPDLPCQRPYNDLELGGWLGRHGVPVAWDSRNDAYSDAEFARWVGVATLQDMRPLAGADCVLTERPELADAVIALGWRPFAQAGPMQILLPP